LPFLIVATFSLRFLEFRNDFDGVDDSVDSFSRPRRFLFLPLFPSPDSSHRRFFLLPPNTERRKEVRPRFSAHARERERVKLLSSSSFPARSEAVLSTPLPLSRPLFFFPSPFPRLNLPTSVSLTSSVSTSFPFPLSSPLFSSSLPPAAPRWTLPFQPQDEQSSLPRRPPSFLQLQLQLQQRRSINARAPVTRRSRCIAPRRGGGR
jgi:hypothetical protein